MTPYLPAISGCKFSNKKKNIVIGCYFVSQSLRFYQIGVDCHFKNTSGIKKKIKKQNFILV